VAAEVPRSVVEDFYKVYAARDVEKIAEFLADDVEWTISGCRSAAATAARRR
jgi:ketosteroid isomerase-like protein